MCYGNLRSANSLTSFPQSVTLYFMISVNINSFAFQKKVKLPPIVRIREGFMVMEGHKRVGKCQMKSEVKRI